MTLGTLTMESPPTTPLSLREDLVAVALSRDVAAFERLVVRHTGLVRRASQRQFPRDPGLADEAAQAAFWALWTRTQAVPNAEALPGWLIRSTQLAAMALRREAGRRKSNEGNAAMEQARTSGDDAFSAARQHLDAALTAMPAKLSAALIAQYLGGSGGSNRGEAASELGISPEAQKKRVQRGLEWLRSWYAERGVVLGVTGLGIFLGNESVACEAAPTWASQTSQTVVAGKCSAGVVLAGRTIVNDAVALTRQSLTFKAGLGAAGLLAAGIVAAWLWSPTARREPPHAGTAPAIPVVVPDAMPDLQGSINQGRAATKSLPPIDLPLMRGVVPFDPTWIKAINAQPILPPGNTRFHEYARKFYKVPNPAGIEVATYLGGPGSEWLAGGGFQDDGSIVVAARRGTLGHRLA